jgi:hypothetical protein
MRSFEQRLSRSMVEEGDGRSAFRYEPSTSTAIVTSVPCWARRREALNRVATTSKQVRRHQALI